MGLNHEDFLRFNRLLASLVESGLPLGPSMFRAAEKVRDPGEQGALQELASRVDSGMPLERALEGGREFPPAYGAMLGAGQRSGDFSGALRLFVRTQEQLSTAAAEAGGLLVYPATLFSLLFLFCATSLLYILPAQQDFARDFLAGSEWAAPRQWGLKALFLLIGLLSLAFSISLWRYLSKAPSAREIWSSPQRWLLQVPVLGGMTRRFAALLFLRQISAHLKAGLPLNQALQSCAPSFEWQEASQGIAQAARNLEHGQPAAEALEALGFIPSYSRAAFRGVTPGNEAEHLDRISESLERDLRHFGQAGLELFETGLTIVMGALVGTGALMLWQSQMNLYSVFQH